MTEHGVPNAVSLATADPPVARDVGGKAASLIRLRKRHSTCPAASYSRPVSSRLGWPRSARRRSGRPCKARRGRVATDRQAQCIVRRSSTVANKPARWRPASPSSLSRPPRYSASWPNSMPGRSPCVRRRRKRSGGCFVCGFVRDGTRCRRGLLGGRRSHMLPLVSRRAGIALQAGDGLGRPRAVDRRGRAGTRGQRGRRCRLFAESADQRLRRSPDQRELGTRGSAGDRRTHAGTPRSWTP